MQFARVLLWGLLIAPTAIASEPIDFDTEIVPIFSKAGCNAAACHGGAGGQAGFRLSLFGGDPDLDYRMVVREVAGRRVNLADPGESLLIAKPTGLLDHGGGYVLESESNHASTLMRWIAEGAGRPRTRQLESLALDPAAVSLTRVPAEITVTVRATFDDGNHRDVTGLATFTPLDKSAVEVASTGTVRVLRPGQQHVIVRFASQAVPLTITAPLGDSAVADAGGWPPEARQNWIDDEILATLAELQLPVSPPASDEAFARRIYLDLCGRLPTPAEQRSLWNDNSSDKRGRLVEQLLASEEHVRFWTFRLAQLLRVRPPGNDREAARLLTEWIAEQLRSDTPYFQIARDLIVAEGDSHAYPPATIHRLHASPRDQAEYFSEVFLGVRLRCANCHNHPLDRWTQDDYHGLAQVFARLERGQVVRVAAHGEVIHPRTGLPAAPRIPGERTIGNENAREELAAWLIEPGNPYFARAIVGRVWRMLMGRGLVEPADDLRATNPASHPALLNRLASYFVQHDCRLRDLIRVICSSAAYGRSSVPLGGNVIDDRFYAYAYAKPLDAEVIADAISDVTGVASSYDPDAAEGRAIEVVAPRNAVALDALGRCDRSGGCESPPAASDRLATWLQLLNGPLINERLTDRNGRLREMIEGGESTRAIVESFCRYALCRPVTDRELEVWVAAIPAQGEGRTAALEDFVWSLLNCREFGVNH